MVWQVNLNAYGAVGDGVEITANNNAYSTFKTDALARPDLNELVELTQDPGHYLISASLRPFDGIKNFHWLADDAHLQCTGSNLVFFGGQGVIPAGGVAQSGGPIADADRGQTSVTFLVLADASKLTVGRYACVMGFDMQGLLNADFGFPPNPAFHDYVLVSAINTETGVVDFTPALSNDYKAHWPDVGADPGAAHIVPLFESWNCEHYYRGPTVTQGGGNVGSKGEGRKITWENATFTGGNGITPTQNGEIHLLNYSGANNNIEVDKMVDLINAVGGSYKKFHFQSRSIKRVVMDGAAVPTFDGTGKDCLLKNMVITTFKPGVTGYGYADKFRAENCQLGSAISSPPGFQVTGAISSGDSRYYDWVNGTIIVPVGSNVVGFAPNPDNKLRLEVESTEGFIDGKFMRLLGIGGLAGLGLGIGNGQGGGDFAITVIDGTHVDVLGVAITSQTYTGGGLCYNVNPFRALIPGSYFLFLGSDPSAPGGRILDAVKVDGQYLISTDRTDLATWPDIAGTTVNIAPNTLIDWSVDLATTIPLHPGYERAPPRRPLGTWWQDSYDSSSQWPFVGSDPQWPGIKAVGWIEEITIEVLQAQVGSTTTFNVFSNANFYDASYNRTTLDWHVDPTAVHTVTITPAGVSGTQGNDSIAALGGERWLTSIGAAPHVSNFHTGTVTQQANIRVTVKTNVGPPNGQVMTCNFVVA